MLKFQLAVKIKFALVRNLLTAKYGTKYRYLTLSNVLKSSKSSNFDKLIAFKVLGGPSTTKYGAKYLLKVKYPTQVFEMLGNIFS